MKEKIKASLRAAFNAAKRPAFPEAEEPRAMVVGVHHRSHLCALSVHRVILNHPEAMKKRLTAEQWQQEFRQLLNVTIVTFHYRKKDRTLRKATGTTCLDLIPTDSLPKGIGAPAPKGQVRYYDLPPLTGRGLERLRTVKMRYAQLRTEHPTVGADPRVCPPIMGICVSCSGRHGSLPLQFTATQPATQTVKGNHNYQLSTINYQLSIIKNDCNKA